MKRYNDENQHFKNFWGERVQKIGVDGGFTCPNRDGSKGLGGCSFCNNEAFTPYYSGSHSSISEQLKHGIEFYSRKYKAKKFIAYFQSFSGTYQPTETLRSKYNEALSEEGVVGLTIATRPDCLHPETASLLAEFNQKTVLTIELGLESCYNETLAQINRGHTFEDFEQACQLMDAYKIPITTHLILGLPGDSRERIVAQADILSKLPIECLKLHQLQVLKQTPLHRHYMAHPDQMKLYSASEYTDILIAFLERLSPKIKIGRLLSEVPLRYIEAPDWNGMKYKTFLDAFELELERRNTYQGRLFKGTNSL